MTPSALRKTPFRETVPSGTFDGIVRTVARPVRGFRVWFESFDAAEWDRQIEGDAAAGKLDRLAEEALAEYRAGRTRPL